MTTFTDLQNGFYNALCTGLGQSPNSFQMLQPTTPLVTSGDSKALWAYFNNIPPASLTQNYIAGGGNQFFTDYSGLLSALNPSVTVNLEADIGTAAYTAWLTYIQNYNPTPSTSQLPSIFRNWAMIRYPSVATKGASDLATMLLDPISKAQLAMEMYDGKTPDWSLGLQQLIDQLAVGQAMQFTLSSSTMNSNVSQSWTHGQNSGFLGLWGSDSSTSTFAATFASQQVTVQAKFDHIITFSPVPGDWYNSSAMGNAYANPGSAPWNPNSTLNWTNTFDPSKGNMARFMSNVIVASGMTIQVNSSASFSKDDQQTIIQNSSAGLWPFYTTSSNTGVSTQVSFSSTGQMQVTITSTPGTPLILGGNVIPVSTFVGHSVAALKAVAA